MPFDTESADALQQIIERQQSLTTLHEQGVQSRIAIWSALRDTDVPMLRREAEWPTGRPYIPDPLPQRISEAFADLLFGEDPQFIAAEAVEAAKDEEQDAIAAAKDTLLSRTETIEDAGGGPDRDKPPEAQDDDSDEPDSDQELLDNIIEANELPSDLHASEVLCSSEGEVWWRIYIDASQIDYPIIQWYSRSHVRPLFRGRRLVAAAFYDDVYTETVAEEYTVYRWVGIYSAGHVRNLLYRGTPQELGTKVPLDTRPETKNMRPDWNHEFEMLCGRVPNKLGKDRRVGVSDYVGNKELYFSLNEATSVGHENMRLTAKKRAIVPVSSIKDGVWDAGEDVIPVSDEDLDTELGRGAIHSKFAVLEYTFDAEALVKYKDDLTGVICTRSGVVQQFLNVGSGSEGLAVSGTALRVRLIPTTLAARGKARFWDDALPKILMLAQLIDKDEFNRPWNMAGEPPAVERAEPLPEDETEEVNRHSAAVTAEIESRRTAIKAMHPDWTKDQIDAELAQIMDETTKLSSAVGGGMGGPPAPFDEGAPVDAQGNPVEQPAPPDQQPPPTAPPEGAPQ